MSCCPKTESVKHYFDNAKVGEEVESLVLGPGTIISVILGDLCPITVLYDSGGTDRYTLDGEYSFSPKYHGHQVLFYPGVKVITPKRKVTKTVLRYANLYKTHLGAIYDSIDDATGVVGPNAVRVAMPITITYEIEG